MVRLLLLTLTLVFAVLETPSFAIEAQISRVHACPSSFNQRLIEGNDGALYGFAYNVIYRVTPSGSYRVIYRFDGSDSEGVGSLVFGNDGLLYGTTAGVVEGTAFQLSLSGNLRILHRFKHPTEGSSTLPACLLQAPDGNFYGRTFNGGTHDAGTIFQVTSAGAFATLVDLGLSGVQHYATSLVVGHDGAIWGTDSTGKIFRMTLDGQVSDPVQFGTLPAAATSIVPHADGNYYVFTDRISSGPNIAMCRLTPDGDLTTIREIPLATGAVAPTSGRDGYLYVVFSGGGPKKFGSISRIDVTGQIENLGVFGSNLVEPAGAVQNHSGDFYGVTIGLNNLSAVYRVRVPGETRVNLPPFARNDLVSLPAPGVSISIPVLRNDRDIDNDVLAIGAIDPPVHGIAEIDPIDARKIRYTAPSDFDGTLIEDPFRYRVDDGQGHSSWARVIVRQPVSGNFQGLVTDNDPRFNGNLTVSVLRSGAITGRLWMGGITWALRGALDANNRFVDTLRSDGAYIVDLSLELLSDAEGPRISAMINFADTTRTLDLTTASRATAQKVFGQYTVSLPADANWADLPAIVPGDDNVPDTANPVRNLSGNGYATMNVGISGSVRITGRTPNNRSFATANYLNRSGELPFFVATDRQTGSSPRPMQGWLSGKVTFRDTANVSDADGTLRWRIPYRGYGYYLAPLADVSLKFVASKYLVPASGTSPLTGTALNFTASGGGLSEDRTAALHFTSATELRSPVIDGDTRVLTALNAYNGSMIGAVRFAPNPIDYSFRGVVLQKQNRAVGLFQFQPGTAKTGAVDIQESSP